MPTPPDSESAFPPAPINRISQEIDETQGQIIAQMMGGLAIGHLTVYLSHAQTEAKSPQPDTTNLRDNPYRGLLAFREIDGDRFFGRETQIEQLWEKFCHLHEHQSTVRVLPIYGPSGSGKSSLARAGLIPALGKKPLPGRDHARLAVLVPGTHPLEALATVLARIVKNDSTPVEKAQEFERVLATKSDAGNYEGLRRIADVLPDIEFSPLIILVDQFEEVYTYAFSLEKTEREAFIAERDAFIENLLCAAAEPTKRVSVILTLRSDFLGDTQQHPRLNKLFSTQGFLVPIMQPEELEIAIAKPAEQAGNKLDKAIVKLLVEQTQGREGALPLLQFALTRIWEGLQNGVDPATTLHNIGGVGGALAGEAQHLYQSLSADDQAIARCIFLALVQLNEDSGDTRRRAAVSELIASDGDEIRVRSIINLFAEPRVRFLVRFSDKQYGEMIEMIEVAHEALIRNWKQLRDWLKECREALRKKRKIEDAAEEWKHHKKSKDYLLQGRSLRDAREFMQAHNSEISLSGLAKEFVKASRRKQLHGFLKIAIIPFMGTLIPIHFFLLILAQTTIYREDAKCQQNLEMSILVWYLVLTGQKDHLEEANFCNDNLSGLNLSGATLFRSNFRLSQLENTNFQKAFLVKANFQGANLRDADFSEASLQEADFKESILYGTDIRTAQKITDNQLESSLLCKTKIPAQSRLNPDRDCKKLGL
ncbi:nSTAND1 domain-containing NTPase [Allocoleopsis franciscana]|uniref:Putative low-complexity protein n=2 Tax=Allocoleopsis TaxID=2886347 RepID=K9WPQ7_9CYAN|nr:putative low-complexity protein [Allocoleopsis franciscana PCC 7113]